MASTHRRVSAFTLIELLVAVALIVLLISLLLPALAGAKESALMVQCQSNNKNLAIANTSYMRSNDNHVLGGRKISPQGGSTSWPKFGYKSWFYRMAEEIRGEMPFYGDDAPADPGDVYWNNQYDEVKAICKEVDAMNCPVAPIGVTARGSLAPSDYVNPKNNDSGDGRVDFSKSMDRMAYTSDIPDAGFGSRYGIGEYGPLYHRHHTPEAPTEDYSSGWEQYQEGIVNNGEGVANVSFFDGHVEGKKWPGIEVTNNSSHWAYWGEINVIKNPF